jgi:cytochrome c556
MSRSFLCAPLVLLSVTACKQPPAPALAAPPVAASAAPAPPSAEAALDQLDTRMPVPLLPHMAQHQKENMREHLLAVQEIALAAARSDFAAVEQASGKLGLSAGMERMCNHMGRGAPGFTDQALAFHRSADEIAAAARKHSSPAVMKALGTTLQLCTGCHAAFRQKVVDEATWTRLTATAAPNSDHGISGG